MKFDLSDCDWMPNLQGTKMHLAITGYTGRGTGVVAACDTQGIFLIPSDMPGAKPVAEGTPLCRACSKKRP